jgi:hypothetical protein
MASWAGVRTARDWGLAPARPAACDGLMPNEGELKRVHIELAHFAAGARITCPRQRQHASALPCQQGTTKTTLSLILKGVGDGGPL